jgi:hypothetical protein
MRIQANMAIQVGALLRWDLRMECGTDWSQIDPNVTDATLKVLPLRKVKFPSIGCNLLLGLKNLLFTHLGSNYQLKV